MSISLGILGVSPRITITVPQERGVDPIATMNAARRRFASYGAEHVTLIPHRDGGERWTITKKEEEN